jgi:hypothetical protein
VDNRKPAAGKQALKELFEARAARRDLGPRRACAARLGTHVAEPAQQGGQALVDQTWVQRRDVGAGALGVDGAAVRAKASAACRTPDVQA